MAGRHVRERRGAVARRGKTRWANDRALRVEQLEDRRLLAVSDLFPEANSHDADVSTSIEVDFTQAVDSATATDQTIVVHGGHSGRLLSSLGDIASLSASGAQVTLDPAQGFHAGELVQVTITEDLLAGGGGSAGGPYVWQFRTATVSGPGLFTDSGQTLGGFTTYYDVELGDVNGDGYLDAIVGGSSSISGSISVWLNLGSTLVGRFVDSGQSLSNSNGRDLALGDLDGDGDLDAFIAKSGPNRVWYNQGGVQGGTAGVFTISSQLLGTTGQISNAVSLGDLDGDGDLDAFVANSSSNTNQVWINQGGAQGGTQGEFAGNGQSFGSAFGDDVSLGDVDADGDLDAFVTRSSGANRLWINQGGAQGGTLGQFSDSGQALGGSGSIELGDIDGDGDLDATTGSNRLWINQGGAQGGTLGQFSETIHSPSMSAQAISLGDLDGDGDLDGFFASSSGFTRVWLNQGGAQGGTAGQFLENGQALSSPGAQKVALGDLDGDGDLDAFVATSGPNRIWMNGTQVDLSVSASSSQVAVTQGATVSYTIVVSGDATEDVDGVAVRETITGPLLNVSWTTTTTGGATAPHSGSGEIDTTVDLPAGSTVTFHVTAEGATAGSPDVSAQSIITNSVRLVLPAEFYDTQPSDNSAQDGDVVVLAAPGGSGQFEDSGQSLGNSHTRGVSLGDFDGDGDLDAFVPSFGPNRVWVNQGGAQSGTAGQYLDSGQALGNQDSYAASLADLDHDGDLDVFVVNGGGQANQVWVNQGGAQGGVVGVFVDSGLAMGSHDSEGLALGDLDGDGDLDAFVANSNFDGNQVWLNQSVTDDSGTTIKFVDSGQTVGSGYYVGVVLGDMDGDGDLDAVLAHALNTARLFINQGGDQGGIYGQFIESEDSLGGFDCRAVSLGDLDGDGDLDVFVASYNWPHTVRINQGGAQGGAAGTFLGSGQGLGNSSNRGKSVSLGDVDADGDLDAVVANEGQANQLWLNQGGTQRGTVGQFVMSGQALGVYSSLGVALGDLDDDGDLDAFFATGINQSDRVWLNRDAVDLSVTKTANQVAVTQGSSMSYTIVVSGDPYYDVAGAVVTDTFSSPLSNVSWTTSTTGGATAPASGNGDINVPLDLPAGSTVTFHATADVPANAANTATELIVTNSAHVSPPAGLLDNDPLDNYDSDSDVLALAGSDGTGLFYKSGQTLGGGIQGKAVLGDLDGDGDLDAFVIYGGASRVWLNQGGVQEGTEGIFLDSGQVMPNLGKVSLGDVDGDGDLDVFAGGGLWFNQGGAQGGTPGVFVVSTQDLAFFTYISLGDVDGDGDLDALTTDPSRNRVLLNQGGKQGGTAGEYLSSGQDLGSLSDLALNGALGDLDGDGDLDAMTVGYSAIRVWVNQGGIQGGLPGTYVVGGQQLGPSFFSVFLGDVDLDGDLDAFTINSGSSRLWFNQGGSQGGTVGTFIDSGQPLPNVGDNSIADLSLGDVDGDGDLDFMTTHPGGQPRRVFLNQGGAQGGTVGLFLDSGQRLGSSPSNDVALGDLDGDGDLDAFVTGENSPNQVWLNVNVGAPALDGDFNGNNKVDAADYSVWRDAMTFGATTLLNDPTPGTVDESDFQYWRAHFGETLGAGAGSASIGLGVETEAVAEPMVAMAVPDAKATVDPEPVIAEEIAPLVVATAEVPGSVPTLDARIAFPATASRPTTLVHSSEPFGNLSFDGGGDALLLLALSAAESRPESDRSSDGRPEYLEEAAANDERAAATSLDEVFADWP